MNESEQNKSETKELYEGFEHRSVMLRECLDYMNCQAGDRVLDYTFGGGGHSLAVLEQVMPGGEVIAFDRDQNAIKRFLKNEGDIANLNIHHANMSEAWDILSKNHAPLDFKAAILDCGVSSFQLDQAQRGFSYRFAGPLDMRMDDTNALTALDFLQSCGQNELEQILRDYSDERLSGRIARCIKEDVHKMTTTLDLVASIERSLPGFVRGKQKTAVLSRVFQAIRMAVNEELKEIETALNVLCENMVYGARIVVLTFHSIEDRLVKHLFKRQEQAGTIKRINKKVIEAQADELQQNIRSRSAKLRVVERQFA